MNEKITHKNYLETRFFRAIKNVGCDFLTKIDLKAPQLYILFKYLILGYYVSLMIDESNNSLP